jgi:hypothetical protein
LSPNSPTTIGRPRLVNDDRYADTSAAVSKTPYMWMLKIVLPVVSAAITVGALSRMVKVQSWPQFGASTMIVCWKPALRSLRMAFDVSVVHAA